jgi:hypothetical protein
VGNPLLPCGVIAALVVLAHPSCSGMLLTAPRQMSPCLRPTQLRLV